MSSCSSALASVHLAPLAAPRLGCCPDTLVAAQLRRRIVQRKMTWYCETRQIKRGREIDGEKESKKHTHTLIFKNLHKSLDAIFSSAHPQSCREFQFDDRAHFDFAEILFNPSRFSLHHSKLGRRSNSSPETRMILT